jgi:hypothetical protein
MKDEPVQKEMIQRVQEILERNKSYPIQRSNDENEQRDYWYLHRHKSKLEGSTDARVQELYGKINAMKDDPACAEKIMIQRLKKILDQHKCYPKRRSTKGNNDYYYLHYHKSQLEESIDKRIQEMYKKIIAMKQLPTKKESKVTHSETEEENCGEYIVNQNYASDKNLEDVKNDIEKNEYYKVLNDETVTSIFQQVKDPIIERANEQMIQWLKKILHKHQSYPTCRSTNGKHDYYYLLRNKSKLENSTDNQIQNLYEKILAMKDDPVERANEKMIQRLKEILDQHQSYPTVNTRNGRIDYNYLYNNKSKLEKSTDPQTQELYKKIIARKDEPVEKSNEQMIQRLKEILIKNKES